MPNLGNTSKRKLGCENWKQEKTLFERYHNSTALEWITLLKKKKKNIQFFISKRPASFKKNLHFWGFLSGRGSDPLPFSAKNSFFFYVLP